MPQPIISVERLSKAYRLGMKEEIPDTFVGAMTGWLKAPMRNWKRLKSLNTFGELPTPVATLTEDGEPINGHPVPMKPAEDDILWALRDVSFEVNKGEVVGIIGRNGAGKSTLLKILSRITEPTHGRAVIRGRVSSLLEVGTGFHPELSGRENIYMNGTILGMRKKEIDKKFDEIVEFSGVEKFLDTPIKRYSSGMNVRLAFAVAAHLEPEILIIDEVLAVGDAEFQKKCLGKMQDVAKGGRTVLFVSHNMAAVEGLCSRGIELRGGTVSSDSGIHDVLQSYRHGVFNNIETQCRINFQNSEYFESAELVDSLGQPTRFIPLGSEFQLRIKLRPPRILQGCQISLGIDGISGERLLSNSLPPKEWLDLNANECHDMGFRIAEFPLAPGEYTLKIAILERGRLLESLESVTAFTVTDADTFGTGQGFTRGRCFAKGEWLAPKRASELPAESN